MRKVSSKSTYLHKKIIPIIWYLYFGIFFILSFFQESIEYRILPIICIIAGFSFFKLLT